MQQMRSFLNKRGSGILLHITSLPSAYGIGDLGPQAYRFVDFLASSGQHYWQILPLNPTGTYLGNSPYTSYSVFAGNPLLISPEMLLHFNVLNSTDLGTSVFPEKQVDYESVVEYKAKLLRIAFEKSRNKLAEDQHFQQFCIDHAYWLDEYSLFSALKKRFEEVSWDEWPEAIRDRDPSEMEKMKAQMEDRTLMAKFFQYIFFQQWFSLKDYCSSKNIQIIGDIPIYPSRDSADAWAHPELFKLDEKKRPKYVAGAPPDYFSATGQRWGNPVYHWDHLRKSHYDWWIKRFQHNLKLSHIVRLDHFRGFVAYWEIPAKEETAVNGKWIHAPAKQFFNTILQHVPDLPLIAEDLGVITPDVKEVIDHFGFPGMKVLLFAFGHDLPTNPYAPHNCQRNCVIYTGTHDNNTIRGWYENEAAAEDKARMQEYIGHELSAETVHWEVVRLALASTANLAIIPMQDVLGLGEEARMNLPSQSQGNWGWRLQTEALTPELAERLLKMTRIYGRIH